MKPNLLARMVYHVGSPAMLDGNRFLPDTGMPISNRARNRTRFEDWLPDPLNGGDMDAEVVDDLKFGYSYGFPARGMHSRLA